MLDIAHMQQGEKTLSPKRAQVRQARCLREECELILGHFPFKSFWLCLFRKDLFTWKAVGNKEEEKGQA